MTRQAKNQVVRVVIFPFAGGNASSFYRWVREFPFKDEVSIDVVQLPGRGNRASEPLITEFSGLCRGVYPLLEKRVDEGPCIFLGYSMGAMLAFELACRLEQRLGKGPDSLILAARKSPAFNSQGTRRKNISRVKMVSELRKLGGTPDELLNNPSLYSHYFDVLEADFTALENYQYQSGNIVNAPIMAIGGVDDVETDLAQLYDWRNYTNDCFSMHLVPGGHFFVNTALDSFMNIVAVAVEDDFLHKTESSGGINADNNVSRARLSIQGNG